MTATTHQLAQLNIGRMAAPLDSVQLADFVAGLDPVNALADAAPGFVWRLKDEEGGNATSFAISEDPMVIVNMSVWIDHRSLWNFVYDDAHREFLRRRREFFARMTEAFTVLWWVPAGHRPTLDEARERLEHLRAHGPSDYAFRLNDADVAAPPHVPESATPQ
jgi:hypothetical protein